MMKKIVISCLIACGAGCGILLLSTVVAVACLLNQFHNLFDDSLSKKEICKLVNKNYTVILEDISENDFSDTKNLKGVKDVDSSYGVVEVYCGGRGFVPSTSYYGFYYSPDDLPLYCWDGIGYYTESLKPDGKGFSIKYSDDDNSYYTEKIRDNFYYYEAHF